MDNRVGLGGARPRGLAFYGTRGFLLPHTLMNQNVTIAVFEQVSVAASQTLYV